ncbi:hypothetical protein IPU22_08385 [Staphylococcus delphini]|uniref:Uncharacterized protein n=1 Tax=Staphylococcus delphini TaxID=53344 RepID=A0AAQ0IHI4_9STAP|nr:hypothetical protein B4W69_13535 [Staphylococcus delphini]QUM68176.1 hypothetical protein IPU21_08435 [Staphylococcus delphini]QUM70609.1 hypothetical protein IPU22_08385 [Staphylococcus delphini]
MAMFIPAERWGCSLIIELIGYHGTTQDNSLSIIRNKSFKKSNKKNEWLGHGAYFYELYEKAEWWASLKKNPAIIKAKILVAEKSYINLDKPSEEDKLGKFIETIEKSGMKFTVPGDTEEIRCQIMNLYMSYGNFKVISGTLPSTNKRYKRQLDSIGYPRTEKQICVHDVDCIVYNELEVVNC